MFKCAVQAQVPTHHLSFPKLHPPDCSLWVTLHNEVGVARTLGTDHRQPVLHSVSCCEQRHHPNPRETKTPSYAIHLGSASRLPLQVLITSDSCRVHREVLKFMPILRRLTKAKLNDDQVRTVSDVLEALTSFCHVPYDPEERHPMNQSILINHGTTQHRRHTEMMVWTNAVAFCQSGASLPTATVQRTALLQTVQLDFHALSLEPCWCDITQPLFCSCRDPVSGVRLPVAGN